jgi:hypothetical protein
MKGVTYVTCLALSFHIYPLYNNVNISEVINQLYFVPTAVVASKLIIILTRKIKQYTNNA